MTRFVPVGGNAALCCYCAMVSQMAGFAALCGMHAHYQQGVGLPLGDSLGQMAIDRGVGESNLGNTPNSNHAPGQGA